MSKRAILLLNLGSPSSTKEEDVREYLREFLMDGRVLNAPWPIRWLVVNLAILPSRPANSAEAYEQIWTPEGSPLIVTSQAQAENLAKATGEQVELGMRYGEPSTPGALRKLAEAGVEEVFVMPLYPHYAMSSYETARVYTEDCNAKLSKPLKLHYLEPFYKETDYIKALVEVARPQLEAGFDKLLFSFHGIPEEHLQISDPTKSHCLKCENCCEVDSSAHATCYRHQCFETVKAFAREAGLKEEQYTTSFQSRLGRKPWLRPYTDFVLQELPAQGVKRLLVICPAFVTDNLETLEEIAMSGRETFLEAGGESFALIPCLNTHPAWIDYLAEKVRAWS